MKVHIGNIHTGEIDEYGHRTVGEFKEEPCYVGTPETGSKKLFQVVITDHPLASKGVPKIVGHCGVEGGIAPLAQHFLEPAEIEEVCKAVKEWQEKQKEKTNAE